MSHSAVLSYEMYPSTLNDGYSLGNILYGGSVLVGDFWLLTVSAILICLPEDTISGFLTISRTIYYTNVCGLYDVFFITSGSMQPDGAIDS